MCTAGVSTASAADAMVRMRPMHAEFAKRKAAPPGGGVLTLYGKRGWAALMGDFFAENP